MHQIITILGKNQSQKKWLKVRESLCLPWKAPTPSWRSLVFHYLSAFACKTRVCSWSVLSGQLDNPAVAIPFGQLQTRRLNLLPSLLQRRQKRRSRSARPKGLCADLGNEHASSSTSGKQDLAAVCTPIDALHCTNSERLTILMFLIPTLMTVSLKQGRINPEGERACNSRTGNVNGKIQNRRPDILLLDRRYYC